MSRRYATLPLNFFTSPEVRPLSTGAKLLYAYLHVNPASNLIGLYYLPKVLIATETGLSKAAAGRAWIELEAADLVRYDDAEQLVYLPGFMTREAGGALSAGDRRVMGAVKEARAYTRTFLLGEFLAEHPAINGARHGASDGAWHGGPMPGSGSGSGSGSSSVGICTEIGNSTTHARGKLVPSAGGEA